MERSTAVKKLLLFAGAVGFMALASNAPARADAFVDSPSFGRIVFGMTGGTVVLPQDAWQGAYPDGSSTTILPNPQDTAFGGAAVTTGHTMQFAGDQGALAGTAGTNFGYDYAGALLYNGGATTVATNASGIWDSGDPTKPQDLVRAFKYGFKAAYAWESQIGIYEADGVTKPLVGDVVTVFGAHTNAGDSVPLPGVTVDNPFAFKYWSDGSVSPAIPAFDYYSDNAANNSGYAANTLYSHFLAYQVTDPLSAYYNDWFIGFEDHNFNVKGAPPGQIGYNRFDFNDTVIEMDFEAVPEPAFYQMAGLLSLGAFGLMRMRRRTS